jgi:hypothetical protein
VEFSFLVSKEIDFWAAFAGMWTHLRKQILLVSSSRSIVVRRVKVTSYEDLDVAKAKRSVKDKAAAQKKQRRRKRKRKRMEPASEAV